MLLAGLPATRNNLYVYTECAGINDILFIYFIYDKALNSKRINDAVLTNVRNTG
jgi:hypothetical protein